MNNLNTTKVNLQEEYSKTEISKILQILEDGRLTDSLGRKVDFRNTILIMTSNVGAHILQRNSSLGFSSGNSEDDFENTKDKIMDEAKKTFKPEFLNRLTEIVIFRPLVKESMRAIVDLELEAPPILCRAEVSVQYSFHSFN